jgi:hypothetical protein
MAKVTIMGTNYFVAEDQKKVLDSEIQAAGDDFVRLSLICASLQGQEEAGPAESWQDAVDDYENRK